MEGLFRALMSDGGGISGCTGVRCLLGEPEDAVEKIQADEP